MSQRAATVQRSSSPFSHLRAATQSTSRSSSGALATSSTEFGMDTCRCARARFLFALLARTRCTPSRLRPCPALALTIARLPTGRMPLHLHGIPFPTLRSGHHTGTTWSLTRSGDALIRRVLSVPYKNTVAHKSAPARPPPRLSASLTSIVALSACSLPAFSPACSLLSSHRR